MDGLYVHVPFCARKCRYCDFTSLVAPEATHAAFVRRLAEEARAVAPHVRGGFQTIFIGGGTPSVLSAALWRDLLCALRETFDLSSLVEFTVEANPESVRDDLLEALTEGGVNRLSLGAQTFDAALLDTLGRAHTPTQTVAAVRAARRAGFANLNLDLIFALPGQTPKRWRADLDRALALGPEHLSCYALSWPAGTPLARMREEGSLAPCAEDTEAAMFEATMDAFAAAGFEHYEVSNFARPGFRCRHNLIYWTGGTWLALGPGAAGHADGLRWQNAPDLEAYLRSAGGAPLAEVERLDAETRARETIMLGLRLLEGLPLAALAPLLTDARRAAVTRHVRGGRLRVAAGRLRLTRRGLLVADSILEDLL